MLIDFRVFRAPQPLKTSIPYIRNVDIHILLISPLNCCEVSKSIQNETNIKQKQDLNDFRENVNKSLKNLDKVNKEN